MQQRDGYSFYGQNMRPNQNQPHYKSIYNNNQYPNKNNYYPNQQNKIAGQYSNINPNQNKNNYSNLNNNRPAHSNKKYSDLEIRTIFTNSNNSGLSSKDLKLQSELDSITNQYMSIFNNINKLSENSSKGEIDFNYQLSKIKKELAQVDNFNGNEYSNFISQLYEVSKDDSALNSDYDSFKKNNKEINGQIKTIINNFKYDIVLYKNKNTTTPQIYQKLNDYINQKKNKGNNYNSSSNYNNNNNYNSSNNYKYNQNTNQNSIYEKNPNNIYKSKTYESNDDDEFNLLKPDTIYQNNKKYDDPNDISDYKNDNYNTLIDDENKGDSSTINVKFLVDGNEIFHEIKANESGEVLQLLSMQEKDDPKIYTQDGRFLTYDLLFKLKVGEIFKNCEPTLNIY